MMRRHLSSVLVGLVAVTLTASGCKSLSKTQTGVLIGAGAGGAVGAGVGKASGNTALGAIIGATVGGVAGGIIGKQMDKQAEEIEQIAGAEVKRVGEGINVTLESGVLFGLNQSSITTNAQTKIKSLAEVLVKYPDTYVLIEGHTDASGTERHNKELSEKRAKSVALYLGTQSITTDRLKVAWYGEAQPKFGNDTEENKAKNRRVEFAIYANEQMKEKAQTHTSMK